MANREQFKLTTQERHRRSFSETFKRNKVQEIESKQVRVSDICRQYSVSAASVYRWINVTLRPRAFKKNNFQSFSADGSSSWSLLAG